MDGASWVKVTATFLFTKNFLKQILSTVISPPPQTKFDKMISKRDIACYLNNILCRVENFVYLEENAGYQCGLRKNAVILHSTLFL